MTTVNRTEFFEAMGGGIEVSTMSPDLLSTLDRAGVSPAQLADIAGDDGVIDGNAEMAQLFGLVDGFDRDGSRQSLQIDGTASGELFTALRDEAMQNLHRAHGGVCEAPTNAPADMTSPDLWKEYSQTKDPARKAELRTEIEQRGATANQVKYGTAMPPSHDKWHAASLEPQQFELRTRSYAPFARFGTGADGAAFEGDHRGATPRLDVTSRMTQATVVDMNGADGPEIVATRAYSDESKFMVGDHVARRGTATPRGQASADGGHVSQTLAGNVPLIPSPDIDLDTDVWMRRDGNSLVVQGMLTGDGFPSAEVLLTDPSGQTLLIHAFNTDAGEVSGPFGRLPGDGSESMGSFALEIVLDGDGNFAAVKDPATGRLMSVDEWNTRMQAVQ